ncbi:MAG: TonB-dependent receptor [Bacteroidales bacterium]|nr:TonB-dependent receptor [Bacteroidales bacterium]
MRNIYLLPFFLFISFFSFSQNRIVSGFIRDSLTNEPLIGATIWDEVQKTGTATDLFGHYSLSIPSDSTVKLVASFIGYQAKSVLVENNLRIDFDLSSGVELDEIAVRGQKKIENRIEMGVVSLPVSQMKTLPIIGEPDVLKVMQLMPGIQGGSEGRSGLYVRGGSPDQNLMLLDGASVYYVNHYGNFLSLFHPEIISNMKLYKCAFPAKYGGRLSSVVDLRMREGNKKEHHGSFGIGLLSADILLEGSIKKDTTSYIFSARRFYLDAIMRPAILLISDFVSVGYQFYDVYGKIAHTFNDNNRLYISCYNGNDSYGYDILPWEDEDFKGKSRIRWGNTLATVRFNSKLNKRLMSDFVAGYTRYHTGQSQEFYVDSSFFKSGYLATVQDFSLKSEFNYTLSNKYQMAFGGGIVTHNFQPGTTTNFKSINDSTILNASISNKLQRGIEPYLYFENIFEPTPFLKFNIGARYTAYWVDGVNYQKFEPRLLAVLGTERTGVIKLSYTENMQALHLLSYQNVGTPNDLWMPATKSIAPAMSKQFSIGYAKTFFDNYELSVEAYQKILSNLIDYKDGVSYQSAENDWQQKVETGGEGLSKGIELLLKKNNGKTTGWIGYTLAKTDRYFKNKNNGKRYPYIYDRKHHFSLVVNHKFNKKFNLSASWIFGSGYPLTMETGYYQTYENASWNDPKPTGVNPFILDDNVVLYTGKNGIRMGNSHRLDLGFQIHGKTKRGRDKTWSFNIYNAYNQQNPISYYYDWIDKNDKSKGKSLWQQSGLPIIPSFTYRVKW